MGIYLLVFPISSYAYLSRIDNVFDLKRQLIGFGFVTRLHCKLMQRSMNNCNFCCGNLFFSQDIDACLKLLSESVFLTYRRNKGQINSVCSLHFIDCVGHCNCNIRNIMTTDYFNIYTLVLLYNVCYTYFVESEWITLAFVCREL